VENHQPTSLRIAIAILFHYQEQTMIHAVTNANNQLYDKQLDDMHAMRYEIYVKQRGWTGLQSDNQREYDEYDNTDTVYLMNLSETGALRSTFRLLPTTSPYLLKKLSHFVSGEIPTSPKIWDMTRWMIAPSERRQPGEQRSRAQAELACGLYEFAATRGITHYTTLMDTAFIPALEVAGWRYELLGLPTPYEDGKGIAVAIMIDVGEGALKHIRTICDIDAPVLFESPPPASNDDIETLLLKAEIQRGIGAITDKSERLSALKRLRDIVSSPAKGNKAIKQSR
jgi:N-acyl-L-homoserine lactone synthetase